MNQDEALLLVREQDMMKRMNGGQQFIEFLASPDGDLSMWTNVDKITDSLAAYWVSSSNFKVALLGLDILSLLVERLQRDFQPHYNLIQNALMDRLGDQKDQVRDASITLLTNIMDVAASPQYLFERLSSGFSHKVWRVREGLCRLLVATINRFGAKSLYLSKILPHICKLMSDPNGQVRDIASSTIVEIYRHVGDKVRQDLAKKGLPAAKLNTLYDKFDVILQSGNMVTASDTGSLASSTGSFESGESASSLGLMRPPSSSMASSKAASTKSSLASGDASARAPSSAPPRRSVAPPRSATNPRSNAGAVDEESFIRDFDHNLPPVRLYSAKDVDEQMSRVQAVLSDDKKDWEERNKSLKALRAIVLAGGNEYDSFYQHLRLIEPALQLNAKDLRSQVVRETCVTIGFLSSFVKNQFEHSACALMPILFSLIPNAAKVMSTSGVLSIRTMLKHTHGPRMIPVVTGYCTSRTTSIRRHTFAFLDVIFQHWTTHPLAKHVTLLKESVQKGISDADAEAREEARKAWHGLHQHFPAEAEQVFKALNAPQQKLIKGHLSAASSSENLLTVSAKKPRPSVTTTGAGPRRSVARAPPSAGLRAPGALNGKFLRSRSDIDPASARRSQMKAAGSGYGTFGRAGRVPRYSSTSNNAAANHRGREAERPAVSQRILICSSDPSPLRSSPPQFSSQSLPRPRKFPPHHAGRFASTPPISPATPRKAPCKPSPHYKSTLPERNLPPRRPPELELSGHSEFVPSLDEFDPVTPDIDSCFALDFPHFDRAPARRKSASSPGSPLLSHRRAPWLDEEAAARRAATGSRSNSPGAHRRSLARTPAAVRTSKLSSQGGALDGSADFEPVFAGGREPTRTPPSSPTRKSRIPVSNSRSASRAGSRLGSRVGSPTGSRSGSPPRYKAPSARMRRSKSVTRSRSRARSSHSSRDGSPGRSTSNSHAPPMRVLPKGREGEMALHDALARKLNRRDPHAMSDDDMSDTSSVCSDMSSSYSSRNGLKRHQALTEDVVEILQQCQSSLWTERKEGLVGLHVLINKRKEFSRLQLKKALEIFNRMFADPHGKVFSMFLEMLPDFIINYHEETGEWLYVLLTQLLKKMGSDLLGSVQAKVLNALKIARESYPTQFQFNILSRYIIDQTQRPNLKVKVALLHYLLELVAAMEPGEITNTSDTRLALSRVITWTTEPKSQDVRKVAEALVISVFELNAPVFTMMIRVLPKTFQDGAMKVLQGYKKASASTSSSQSDGGHVMGRVGVAPNLSVVSPRGSVGTLDLMSPRGSLNGDESMDRDEIAENFRDITAGIQKLRMDSSAEDAVARKLSYDSPTREPALARPRTTPHPRSQPSGKENLYNPNAYSDLSPTLDKLKEALFDEDAFNEELPLEQLDSNIADIAFSFTSGKDKRQAIEGLLAALRSSDAVGGLAASQQQIQWDQHFGSVLSGVLEALRSGKDDLRVSSLRALKQMLRHLSTRFRSHAEITAVHILQSHNSDSKEVTRAAEECGNALCTLLPSVLTVKVLSPLARGSESESVQACLKMLTNAVNRSTSEELTNEIVSDLVPGLLQCYDNTESGIRKAAVFCLVALHRVIGDARLCEHLSGLSGGKMKLLQLYIKRSQSNADP